MPRIYSRRMFFATRPEEPKPFAQMSREERLRALQRMAPEERAKLIKLPVLSIQARPAT